MSEFEVRLTGDPALHYERDREAIDSAIHEVLKRGNYVMGPEVPAFESEFAAYCGVDHAVAVTSGTSSLLVALIAAGVEPGDEVITVANADMSISLAAVHRQADLKWVDIDYKTFNMDPNRLREAISDNTRAVVVAHMYGLPADMGTINGILSDFPDVTLIEDASLATGATIDGTKTGAFGDIACFSLASGKVLGVVGSGGILTTNDIEMYRRINWVRHYGRSQSPYRHDDPMPQGPEPKGTIIPGLNERLDTIQAAVGRIKLDRLDEDLAQRRAVARIYDELLEDSACETPIVPKGYTHSYRVYPITVAPSVRDRFIEEMRTRGIQVGAHYVPPDHLHPYFLDRGTEKGLLPTTEGVADSIACLPSHQYMSPRAAWETAEKARNVLKEISP